MNLTIAIDDVNPKKDWRILGDKTEKYLFDLNKEFGAKFTLFIPSNHHKNSPISEHSNWVNELKDSNIFELAAHGHYHETSDKNKFGECEFLDMTENECIERIKLMNSEWEKVNHNPTGWRNPGWLCHPHCVDHLSSNFEYAALHYDHNHNFKWNLKMIFGSDGIHNTDITTHDDNIMLHSHIFGDWNDNVWNEDNYNQVKLSLEYLVENFDIKFKTISEI